MKNKIYQMYFLSTFIDAQFQVLIYLLFFKYGGLWGLSFVLLSKYIIKNSLYKYYNVLFKNIKTNILFGILAGLFGGLIFFTNLVYLIISSSLIIIILSLITIRSKVYISKQEVEYVSAYSKLSLISSLTYLAGTASIWLLHSNTIKLCVVSIGISLFGLLLTWNFNNVELNSSNVGNSYRVEKRLPPIFYIGLITGVLSILVDNYELEYIVSQGYSENNYSIIVFISSFFFIATSLFLTSRKFKIKDNYKAGILGCLITMLGYFVFMHVSSIGLITISMGMIAIGYTLYTTLINAYIAEKYRQNAELYFVKYAQIENYALTIVFGLSIFRIEQLGIDNYYFILSVITGTFVLFLSYILLKKWCHKL